MRTTLAILMYTTLVLAPAQAGGPAKGVVELFTSQGCSDCPPADAALSKIIDGGGYLALAWHVDYWDRLGWKDTFSSPTATARQERYATHIGGGSYTPEFVVNGVRGSSRSESVLGSGLAVDVSVSDGHAHIGAGSGDATVMLVSFIPVASVPIGRGENAGRTVTYRHVVTGVHSIAEWHGQAITVAAAGNNCAVVLQRPGQGEIIGAAQC